jgi:hypothetical protein
MLRWTARREAFQFLPDEDDTRHMRGKTLHMVDLDQARLRADTAGFCWFR